MSLLVVACLLLGIALVTFLATRIARLVAYLRRTGRRSR